MNNWDMKIISLNYIGWCAGFSFYVSTPTFKKRYSDKEVYRCISIHLGICGLDFFITIPLFVDSIEANNLSDAILENLSTMNIESCAKCGSTNWTSMNPGKDCNKCGGYKGGPS